MLLLALLSASIQDELNYDLETNSQKNQQEHLRLATANNIWCGEKSLRENVSQRERDNQNDEFSRRHRGYALTLSSATAATRRADCNHDGRRRSLQRPVRPTGCCRESPSSSTFVMPSNGIPLTAFLELESVARRTKGYVKRVCSLKFGPIFRA
jgi:hypothetical protein